MTELGPITDPLQNSADLDPPEESTISPEFAERVTQDTIRESIRKLHDSPEPKGDD